MSPPLVYYQVVILVLLWVCVMLPSLWPSPPGGAPKTPTTSITSKHKRSTAPKAFAGLTHKPPCALCDQETGETAPALPLRPDPLPSTHRRPRTVDTSRHFCPHPEGDYRGGLGLNNLRAPMVIPVAARGGSSTASAATGIFHNITARLFMASKRQGN